MNKRGFTLIELLAVIVILAIIALIAVPIVLNMIENARKSAAKSGGYGYIQAIDNNNELAEMKDEDMENIPTKIEDGTNINISGINVKMKGKKPTSGTVTITNGRVASANLCINNYTVVYAAPEITNVTQGCSAPSPQPVLDIWSHDGSTITGFKDGYCLSEPDLVVPSQLDGVTITHLDAGTAEPDTWGCNYESIVIPDSIQSINKFFGGNSSLTSVTFGSNLQVIDDWSFQYCALESINLPNSLQTIGDSAFSNNDIRNVTIPSGVTTIESSAFADNENLTNVVNKTGRSFDWCSILGVYPIDDGECTFVTGTIDDGNRVVTVTNN